MLKLRFDWYIIFVGPQGQVVGKPVNVNPELNVK